MYIHNHGSFIGTPVEDLKYYKQDVARFTKLKFRRANRFVLISLAGAARCAHEMGIREETAVYLTTENGNLGDTETVLQHIFSRREFPMPYNFINTMSNTASFYIAQSLELKGRNLTFSSKQFSFERGLELLQCDMNGGVEEALIGGVDEAVFSREGFEAKHGRRYSDYKMVEGSSWLLIRSEKNGAVGEIRPLHNFGDLDAVLAWLDAQPWTRPVVAAFGLLLDETEKQTLLVRMPRARHLDFISDHGYFDSAPAGAVADFVAGHDNAILVHVNKDFGGSYAVMVVEKY